MGIHTTLAVAGLFDIQSVHKDGKYWLVKLDALVIIRRTDVFNVDIQYASTSDLQHVSGR